MKRIRKKIGLLFIITGCMLIAACVVLLIFNHIQSSQANDFNKQIIPIIKENAGIAVSNENPADNRPDMPAPENNIDENIELQNNDMPVLEINGYPCIGILDLPTADLQTAVMKSCGGDLLRYAPGRYYGSIKSRNLVIAGHNYPTGFGKLKNLSRGDLLTFTDVNGVKYYFTVGDIELFNPDDTMQVIKSDWDMTMYTCNYSGDARLTIRCQLIKTSGEF